MGNLKKANKIWLQNDAHFFLSESRKAVLNWIQVSTFWHACLPDGGTYELLLSHPFSFTFFCNRIYELLVKIYCLRGFQCITSCEKIDFRLRGESFPRNHSLLIWAENSESAFWLETLDASRRTICERFSSFLFQQRAYRLLLIHGFQP